MSPYDAFECVVGLEVHCQLLTRSKIFCGCANQYGALPNANTCPVCLGHPGTLPVLNRAVVDLALRLGLAQGCAIRRTSTFARKQYFYPDLSKGYQTSQYDQPICEGGAVHFMLEDGAVSEVPLVRIHMEEDAGKSTHPLGSEHSWVDYNRAGTPLLEIVSGPTMRSPEEAAAYLKALRGVVVALGVSDGNMQEGSFRCDANVSVRKKGDPVLGTRVELKNINSFRFVQMGIAHEFRRQVDILLDGGKVTQETRSYDAEKDDSVAMRGKEDAHDYRYFPCPDLPPLHVDDAWLERVRGTLRELPLQRTQRFVSLGLALADARTLNEDQAVADYFEAALATYGKNARGVGNWVVNDVLRDVKDGPGGMAEVKVSAPALATVVRLTDEGRITGKMAKELYAVLRDTGRTDVETVVKERGLEVVRDDSAVEAAVDAVLLANPKEVEKMKAGKGNVMGFFVGQVMKQLGGKADPRAVTEWVKKKTGA